MLQALKNSVGWYKNPYYFLDRYTEKSQYSFRLSLPGSKNALMTGDPELIDEIIRNKYLIGGRGLRFVQPFTGPRALIVITGQEHLSRRQPILKMFFQMENPWMLELTEKYFDQVAKTLEANKEFQLVGFYEKVGLNVILDYVLGTNAQERAEIYGLFQEWMKSFESPFWIFLKPLQRDLGKLTPWKRFVSSREAIWTWLKSYVARGTFDQRSVLHSLLNDRNKGVFELSDDDLIWQCIELILFGHDTTACGVAWTVIHLLESGLIDSEKMKEMGFREASIKEALRLTPMVVHVTREATEDTQVGKYVIKKGQKVFPCAYLSHHHDRYFEKPEQYKPERFLESDIKALFRSAYFPFGIGQRLCVGMPFALSQMELLLKKTIQHGKLTKVSTDRTRPVRKFIIMAPENGGRVFYASPMA
jgi:cytochrome P450